MIRSTYTYALIEISLAAYQEIKTKLEAAGYADKFHEQDDGKVAIDMHGIALVPLPPNDMSYLCVYPCAHVHELFCPIHRPQY